MKTNHRRGYVGSGDPQRYPDYKVEVSEFADKVIQVHPKEQCGHHQMQRMKHGMKKFCNSRRRLYENQKLNTIKHDYNTGELDME